MKILCDIYKGSKKEEMYLYVPKESGLSDVPENLLLSFGELKLVTTLVLTPSRVLARADIAKVMSEMADKGFYLQLPPAKFPQANIQPEYRT
ncbi:YcgL domain-containing protein [SAR92 clade bacterium H921]|jgi:uncharacterized protein YcgL (UPF0745 family)|nr:YcgL domain-containing protein [SAR92 clade bacterium H921]MDG0972382.1 YcgL domain-containing protein [Porticoccaceae bacterium]MDG1307730.1 YcgL domain-containing protein [Porticoccaceae bacterium]